MSEMGMVDISDQVFKLKCKSTSAISGSETQLNALLSFKTCLLIIQHNVPHVKKYKCFYQTVT